MLILLIAAIIVLIILSINRAKEHEPEIQKDIRPRVTVASLGDLGNKQLIEETSTLEPAHAAPLIARTGGRVTNVRHFVGSNVTAGQLVAEIDGGKEASPSRAQVLGFSNSLGIFASLEKQAINSAQLAITIATTSLRAAQTGDTLSENQQRAALDSAELGVAQAKQQVVQTSNTKPQGVPTEDLQTIITTAELGVEAAQLAQEQARIAQQLSGTQSATAVTQAEQSLQNARIAKERIAAEMQQQRAQLHAQLAVAQAQVQQMQVTAPTSGTIASLTIREGDYVQPGQHVGEVLTVGNAFMRVFVTTNFRNNSQNSLWQIDIVVEHQVRADDLHETATVQFAGDSGTADTLLIPIDSINVREQGVVAFTVTPDGVIEEHVLRIIDYHGNYVEVERTLPVDAQLVVEGNRRVQAGDTVEITR